MATRGGRWLLRRSGATVRRDPEQSRVPACRRRPFAAAALADRSRRVQCSSVSLPISTPGDATVLCLCCGMHAPGFPSGPVLTPGLGSVVATDHTARLILLGVRAGVVLHQG